MYIHQHTCISAQQTFGEIELNTVKESVNNKLLAVEPKYEGIPPGILRRMGKAVRLGVGAALPVIKNNNNIDGIIIGTANGGMEDCIKFLNQIIDYEEGMLTPGNFVQSTPNAIAAQAGLMAANKSYNITHVHRGLAFENSLLDAMMLLKENQEAKYLVGGVDEISTYNYNIDYLEGWYKKTATVNTALYTGDSTGSLAGEGAAMFLVSNNSSNAVAYIQAVHSIHTTDTTQLSSALQHFLQKNNIETEDIDILISGENGDNRLLKYYKAIENIVHAPAARYKHMTGEFPTSTAIAVWLACNADKLPAHMFKSGDNEAAPENILIYNNYKGMQHGFILINK
ncbi:MAG: beta-ketoacyl synthase chain length factor [Chitinophagaceae bacterium]|nr:beta-ketoacyl synthase chain length factor [Chitinophagaceae bacterium]